MTQKDKTKEEFSEEIKLLKSRIAELEKLDSERKQQQDIRRLATVVRDSNDAIIVQDIDGLISAWNLGAERMYGHAEKEVLGMNTENLTPPDKIAEQKEFTRRLMSGEAINSFETQRVTKDGRILDIWLTVTKLLDDTGKPIGIAFTERDITERKKAEKDMALQAHIIENLSTIVAYHDKDLNVIWVNNAYQKVTGLSLEEIKGKKCYHAWNLSKSCRGCPVLTAIETGEKATCELTSDNQDHWPETQGSWLCEATPIRDEHGAVIGAVEFAINITERKKAEVEMANRLAELETYYKASVGREERILELKKEVEELKKELGK